MTVLLLILHGLFAVALLGAITHQAIAACLPGSRGAESFVGRMRSVSAVAYGDAVVVLYLVTAVLGAILYPAYRLNVRVVLEQMQLFWQNGSFELKEHFVAVGLGMLPAYWYFWRRSVVDGQTRWRTVMTVMIAFVVWWSFLVGHILNNVRGFE